MTTALVTGANKGIGLELCRQLKQRGVDVIAACRHSSAELDALGVTVIAGVDVTDAGSIAMLVGQLAGRSLDLLINNAGILTVESLADLDYERIRKQLEVNTLGPLRVTTALLPNLHEGAKVVIVTSRMGSIGDNGSGGYYGYRISKAGVNMAGVSLARDLKSRGIGVFILHPGMVATGMTDGQGIPPAESAGMLLARIEEFGMAQTGTFHHANGEPLPW
jgi:NAD(P)-dependent dehydrogenase (short-subunit alcohol dehydrogenase family)